MVNAFEMGKLVFELTLFWGADDGTEAYGMAFFLINVDCGQILAKQGPASRFVVNANHKLL